MAKKRLVVFYHHSAGNEEIATSDYKGFFQEIKSLIRDIPAVQLESVFCPSVNVLVDKVEQLTSDREDNEELYLHFIGHGSESGIPYDEWNLANEDFALFLDNEKIISCFFASCRSSELVKIANQRMIPIVCGTLSDNDIENKFAIQFETKFYTNLLTCRDFKFSFDHAVATVRNHNRISIEGDVLVRGEGSFSSISTEGLNKMQILFHQEEDKERFIVPSDFLKELEFFLQEKVCTLHWFDNSAFSVDYKKEFDKQFSDRYKFIDLPGTDNNGDNFPGELPLLDRINEIVANGHTRLVLHISRENPLPTPLQKHLLAEKDWKFDHYKPIICKQAGIDLSLVFENPTITSSISVDRIFSYAGLSSELLKRDDFIDKIEQHDIDFNKRREITFDFDTPPVKFEMVENEDEDKFLQIFMANNSNEFLINFLTNWARIIHPIKEPIYIVDNTGNPQLDFLAELKSQINATHPDQGNIMMQLMQIFRLGCVIIFRNKVQSTDEWQNSLQEFLKIVKQTVSMMVMMGAKIESNSFVFFLHNESIDLEFSGDNIFFKSFSQPTSVDKEIIEAWAKPYTNRVKNSPAVIKSIKEISGTMDATKYVDCCPSLAIIDICKGFKIPLNQIVSI